MIIFPFQLYAGIPNIIENFQYGFYIGPAFAFGLRPASFGFPTGHGLGIMASYPISGETNKFLEFKGRMKISYDRFGLSSAGQEAYGKWFGKTPIQSIIGIYHQFTLNVTQEDENTNLVYLLGGIGYLFRSINTEIPYGFVRLRGAQNIDNRWILSLGGGNVYPIFGGHKLYFEGIYNIAMRNEEKNEGEHLKIIKVEIGVLLN